ncbi:MAG: hypothetical protein NC251_07135 [Lachnoclostridium sp.]|nr:hypothetical protein [Lachnospira sp.]MCM1248185.1 hypothetical protein [Lachnoclostridium sp.]MCM1534468.1 hypothetical protein [Clostridium sp.]
MKQINYFKNLAKNKIMGIFQERGMRKEPGIDGILVTVGLCIIALLLCVVMKDSLGGFIETIVQAMTDKARSILGGTSL